MKYLHRLYEGIRCREPVATAYLVRVLVLLLISFGVIHVTPEQLANIGIAVETGLNYWLRSNVVTQARHDEAINVALSLPYTATPDDVKQVIQTKREIDAINKE